MALWIAAALSLVLCGCPSPKSDDAGDGGSARAASIDGGTSPADGGSLGGRDGSVAAFTPGNTFLDRGGTNGSLGEIAIDGSGAVHALYTSTTANESGEYPVRYGECAAGCGKAAGWTFVTIGDLGPLGGYAHLAIDRMARAHAIWTSREIGSINMDAPSVLNYATCASGCTSTSRWQSGAILQGATVEGPKGRALAVDSDGLPRAVVHVGAQGLYFASCESACTLGDSWTYTPLSEWTAVRVSLEFAGKAPRLAYIAQPVSEHFLYYRECSSSCGVAASWSSEIGLYYANHSASLRLTADGSPRLAFNQGYSEDPAAKAYNNKTYYAWCSSGCASPASWSGVEVPTGDLESINGGPGPSLAVRSDGRPVIAFLAADSTRGFSAIACESDCEAESARWSQAELLDSTELLTAEAAAPPPICSSGAGGSGFWVNVGENPQLALDGQDRLHVIYDAVDVGRCSNGLEARELLRLVRYGQR